MKHLPLDIYDDMPHAMKVYLSNFGFHFNKKACDCAVKMMKKKNSSGKEEAIDPWTKDEVNELLMKYGVKLDNDILYDATYQANWIKADTYKSSVPDEEHVALGIKDALDDVDGSDELPFRYWLTKCVALGKPIDFEDLI